MQDILKQSNENLLYEINRLLSTIKDSHRSIPKELNAYYSWALAECDKFQHQVSGNLRLIDLKQNDIIPDILSNTQKVTRDFHLFNQGFTSPILRAQKSDCLCLKLLNWMHSIHPQTRNIPIGLSDGEFGIYPSLPAIYFMPSFAQYGLLYLPLFFHEFGHLLYNCHEQEMKDLVSDLQAQIRDRLILSIQQDDGYAKQEVETRIIIEETWYMWMRELFCDAVGYTIGGTAFIHAFSIYMRIRGKDHYQKSEEDLKNTGHPVSWLRIRLLADRVRKMGYNDNAESLEYSWGKIAETLGITEDYYGFYEPKFLPVIQQTIYDMLIEASPREFAKEEIIEPAAELSFLSPVHLLNQAWFKFHNIPQDYASWEEKAIDIFLEQDTDI